MSGKPRLTVLSYYLTDPVDVGGMRWREMAPELSRHFELCVFTSDRSNSKPLPCSVITVRGNTIRRVDDSGFRVRRPGLLDQRVVRAIKDVIYFPDRQMAWSSRALKRAKIMGRLDSSRDLLVTTSPIPSTHVAALRLRRAGQLPCRWVMDLRDPWTTDPGHVWPRKWPAWLRAREIKLEHECNHRADGVVCATPGIGQMYSATFGLQPTTILNGYPASAYLEASCAVPPGVPTLRYFGKIIPELRDPSLLFCASKALGLKPAQLRFEFWSDQHDYVRQAATKAGVRDLLIMNRWIPHAQALELERTAGANLVLNATEAYGDHMLTTKLFEYVAARRPILAVTGRDSDLAQLMTLHSWGAVAHDLPSACEALTAFVRGSLRSPEDVGRRFSRESLAREYAEFLNQLAKQ